MTVVPIDIDRGRMLAEKRDNPLGFALMKLMRKVWWMRVDARYTSMGGEVELRVTPPSRESKARAGFLAADNSVTQGAHEPITLMVACRSVRFDKAELADDRWLFGKLSGEVRKFVGAGWMLVDELTDEQAWERIKAIRGER